MHISVSQKGQSLVEILFAIAVFTIGVVTIGYLIFDSFASLQHNLQSMQARLLASEGLEVMSGLKNTLMPGTYGLSLESGEWMLVPSSDTQGIFTRIITVEELDAETDRVTSAVTWGSSEANQKSVAVAAQFTDWEQSNGDAGALEVDINNAMLVASSTELTGIALLNNSGEDAVVTGMVLQWDAPAELALITLRGVDVFLASTSASARSGDHIDIDDYSIASGSGYHLLDSAAFDGSVEGSDFIVTFIMSDESKRHVRVDL